MLLARLISVASTTLIAVSPRATPPCRRAGWHSPVAGLTAAAYAVDIAEHLTSSEPACFEALRDETQQRWPGGAHMVSGAQQGRLLHMLVRLSRARRVLEVGCFSGYAALWMGLALPEGGSLLSLERDERAAAVARRHLDAAGVGSRVEVRLGDALEALRALPEGEPPFDLIFVDADKKRTWEYYDLLVSRRLLAPDGLLLVDNVLWKGQVLERLEPAAALAGSEAALALPAAERRSMALRDALHGFSTRLASDGRVQQLLLPLRDGLTLATLAPPEGPGGLAAAAAASAAEQAGEEPAGEEKLVAGASGSGGSDGRLAAYLRLAGSAEPAAAQALRLSAAGGAVAGGAVAGAAPVQQGRLLHMLVRLSRARRVLEVGCFSGYAALWMGLALPEGGSLLSLERDERAAAVARRHLDAAGVGSRVEVRLGDALEALRALPEGEPPFDVVVLGPASAERLQQAARHLAPAGLLVLVHTPAGPGGVGEGGESLLAAQVGTAVEMVHGALPGSHAVVLPSPDGDGGLLTLCVRSGPDDARLSRL